MGVKRSMLTDGRGVPLAIVTAGANTPDVTLAGPTLDALLVPRPPRSRHRQQNLCMDKGYVSDELSRALRRRGYKPHIPPKRRPGQPSAVRRRHRQGKARRWVNERTHSWFNRFRRVLVRWEKQARNYEGVLHFVAAYYTFRQAGVLG